MALFDFSLECGVATSSTSCALPGLWEAKRHALTLLTGMALRRPEEFWDRRLLAVTVFCGDRTMFQLRLTALEEIGALDPSETPGERAYNTSDLIEGQVEQDDAVSPVPE